MVTAACKGVDGSRSGDDRRRLANGNLVSAAQDCQIRTRSLVVPLVVHELTPC